MDKENKYSINPAILAAIITAVVALYICMYTILNNSIISENQSKLIREQIYRDSIVSVKQMQLLKSQTKIGLDKYHLDSIVNLQQLHILKKQDSLISIQNYYRRVANYTRLKLTITEIEEKIRVYSEPSQETIKNNPEFFRPLKLGDSRTLKIYSILATDTSYQNIWAKELLALFESELQNEYLIENIGAYKYWKQEIIYIKWIIIDSDRVIKGDFSMRYEFTRLFYEVFHGMFPIYKELSKDSLSKLR